MAMIVDTKWFGLWHSWIFEITYDVCGYFDPHPEINISLLGLHFMFRLPWKNKGWEDECMPPKYGIMVHDSALWIHYGGKGNWNGGNKYLCWRLPFFTGVHMDNKWMVETVNGMVPTNALEKELNNDLSIYHRYDESDKVLKRTYDYTDQYDGTVVKATYWVEHREWRKKWITWIPWIKTTWDYIEVEFDQEVGKGKGSWKGGCLGCTYTMNKGESPEDCIKRMEKDRTF